MALRRRVAEQDDVEVAEHRRREQRGVERREGVEALVAQDLGLVEPNGLALDVTTSSGGGEASIVKDALGVGGERVPGEIRDPARLRRTAR